MGAETPPLESKKGLDEPHRGLSPTGQRPVRKAIDSADTGAGPGTQSAPIVPVRIL